MQEMLSLLPRAKAASVSFLAAFSGSCVHQQTWCILAIPQERSRLLRQCDSPQASAQPTCRESKQAHIWLPCAPSHRLSCQNHCTLNGTGCSKGHNNHGTSAHTG